MGEKTYLEELKENLTRKKKNGWEESSDETRGKIYLFCDKYIEFLNIGKTEREVILNSEILAKQAGFKNINEIGSLKEGDKVYYINKAKSMYLAVIGKEKLENRVKYYRSTCGFTKNRFKTKSII